MNTTDIKKSKEKRKVRLTGKYRVAVVNRLIEHGGCNSMSTKHYWHSFHTIDEDGNDLAVLRMMEKAGLVHATEDNITWRADPRGLSPRRQAEYVEKLNRLRDRLIHQEQDNLNKTLQRLRAQAYTRESVKVRMFGRRTKDSGPPSFPSRHQKLQAEKMQRLEKYRRGKTPPRLEPLEGRSLLESPQTSNWVETARTTKGDTTRYKEIEHLIESEKCRLPSFSIKLQRTCSIPSIGTKALKPPHKYLSFEQKSLERSDSFVKQMSIHCRNPRTPALYNTIKKRHLLRPDADEVDLSPQTFRFELPQQSGYNSAYSAPSETYSVPRTTPVHWMEPNNSNGFDRKAKWNSNGKPFLRRGQRFYSSGSIPQSMEMDKCRTGPKALSHPLDSRHNVHKNGNELSKRTPGETGIVQSKSVGYKQKGKETDSNSKDGQNRESPREEWSRESSAVQMDQSITLPSVEYDTSSNASDESLSHFRMSAWEHESSKCTGNEYGEQDLMLAGKKQLVVTMPHILFLPPTPSPTPFSASQPNLEPYSRNNSVSLRRIYRQKELNTKEMKNLIEDIKELNQITCDLEKVVVGAGEEVTLANGKTSP